jgi:hypothetical protein
MTERMVNVAIYAGPASTEGMRDKAGVRSQIRDVSFTTGLPGGFLEASFTVSAPISEPTAIIAGQKVIIRRGRVIVWFGWIEDIKRVVRGRTLELQVTCFGPWQEIVQRLVPELSYASMQGDAAIKQEMALNCPNISLDVSQIDATGVDIGPIDAADVRYKSMADLVSLVCNAGDSSNRRVLFAVWEPALTATLPRAALWSRDLSTYDYILRTSLLEQTIEDSASTRNLVNAGVVDYGSLGSDIWAYNTASIATYRQRDRLMNEYPLVFSPSLVAQAMATYLALWANPVIDIGGFSLSRPGAITTKKGKLVELSDVRAGDRLLLVDGPRAGTVIMLASTEWSDGTLSCTPESDYSLVKLVADIYNVVYPNGPL